MGSAVGHSISWKNDVFRSLGYLKYSIDTRNKKEYTEVIDKKSAIEIVRKNGLALKDLVEYQDDKDVVIEAVKQNAKAIIYANKMFFADSEVMTIIVSKKEGTPFLSFLDKSLRGNKEFIANICRYDYKNIKYALPEVADEIRCDALRRFGKKNIRFR